MGMEKLKNICVYSVSNGIYLLLFFIFMFVFPVLAGAEDYVLVNAWGGYGSEIGQFLGLARIAVDKDGNVYVVDRGNDRIQKFFPDGTFAATWKMSGPFVPYLGIAVDKDGYVYVICGSEDLHYDDFCIQVFSSNGEFITKWGSKGHGPGEFYYPMGIAVDENGNVYVADTENRRIQKFFFDGEFITMWGSPGDEPGEFDRPVDIAVDKDGNVYVVDFGNHRIQKFSSNGDFITMWGSFGDGPSEFRYPDGIAVDENGNVYVADQHNNRIQKFSSDGEFITMWGEVGLAHPDGIAVDKDGNVYVVDAGNHRIQKFSPRLSGDCNLDGGITIDEVQKCINCFLLIENECCHKCDLDRNGEVTIDEVQKVINGLLGIH